MKLKSCLLVASMLLTSITCPVGPDTANAAPSSGAGQGRDVESTWDATKPAAFPKEPLSDDPTIISKWYQAADNCDSYTFDYSMTVFKKDGTVTETGKLFFKKPRLLKIQEVGGPKAGSVAILGKDGKVQAHPGGGFKKITVSLSETSHFLKSANGWPMCQSDFLSLAQACKQYVSQGVVCKAAKTPVEVGGRQAISMEMYKGSKIYKRAFFDANSYLPFEWWDYVDGKLWAHSTWSGFKQEKLSDETFTMKGDV